MSIHIPEAPADGGPPPDPRWAGRRHLLDGRQDQADDDDGQSFIPTSRALLDCERCGRRAFEDAAALRRAISLGGELLCGRCLVRLLEL